ncbi:MAG TPA: Crp/Fnr family transcriptional regulator [Vicinamibacterales bacterium]|nr:Crp/Fnr family transcriptional regulator [Vicinamibacterales bacterium]
MAKRAKPSRPIRRQTRTAPRFSPTISRNLLLSSLPLEEQERICTLLEVTSLDVKEVLHKPGELIEHVYFPGGGFCSIVTVLEDGEMVEVAAIGREGMVGVTAEAGWLPLSSAAMVQASTDVCYRMSTAAFRREMDRRGAFHSVVTRYTQALMGVIMQTTACNAAHSIEQRLARWLLLARDRVGVDEFPLTQEFVAMMLGASRSTVTVVAGMLQKAGLITYRRGRLTIIDGGKLESTSCECYRISTNLLRSVTRHSAENFPCSVPAQAAGPRRVDVIGR